MNFSDFIAECAELNKERIELLNYLEQNNEKRLEKLYILTDLVNSEFDKYDINKDGFINFYEYLIYTVSNIKKGKTFDENNYTLISRVELLEEQAKKLNLDDLLGD